MRVHLLWSSTFVIAGLVWACSAKDSKDSPDASGGSAGSSGSGASGGSGGSAGTGSGGTSDGGSGTAGSGGTSDGGAGTAGSGGTEGGVAGSGGTGGSAGTGGASGTPGWTAIPLLDDTTDPSRTIFRSGNDAVTGIYFASTNEGWVTTRGAGQTFSNGGAIYKATARSLTSLLFSGNRDGLCLLGTIDFQGIDKSPTGYVALAHACDVIQSKDNGATFGIEPAQAGDVHGIEGVLTMRSVPGGGTLMYADSGYIDETPGAPGPSATWTTIWAPDAVPTTPNPVPANQCQTRAITGQPVHRTTVYFSATADLIAYVSKGNDDEPVVCVSKDKGKSFFPRALPNYPEDANNFPPKGVVFASDSVGITFWANNVYPDSSYVYRTADKGDTWTRVQLPAAFANRDIDLNSAFFAPNGTHGWIVGYDYDSSSGLVLRTTDAGQTWAQVGGAVGSAKLRSGFALDANRIWVGGDAGTLMVNEAGGE